MSYNCPDRCDIEINYDWNHTNQFLKYLDKTPSFLLNAGDKVEFILHDISPKEIKIVAGEKEISMTNEGEGKWSATIPASWISKEPFNVIMSNGSCKALLYEGLLNSLDTDPECEKMNLPNDFIQTESEELKITRDDELNFHINYEEIKYYEHTIRIYFDSKELWFTSVRRSNTQVTTLQTLISVFSNSIIVCNGGNENGDTYYSINIGNSADDITIRAKINGSLQNIAFSSLFIDYTIEDSLKEI